MVKKSPMVLAVLALLWSTPVFAQEDDEGASASDNGPLAFPVRDPDSDSPLAVVWKLLKLGVEGVEEGKAFQEYLDCVAKDRTGSKDKLGELKEKEFKNLMTNASGYMSQDQYGLKLMVISMNPKPDKVDKNTKKVYIALKNTIEPDDRSGVFILEKGPKGWMVRSLKL